MDITDLDSVTDAFHFLDDLRTSGITNMFGGAAYLIEEFDISKYDANKLLQWWMETFDDREPIERARESLNECY